MDIRRFPGLSVLQIPLVRFGGRTRGSSFGGCPCIFYGKEVRLKTILYIDGFNLYYGSLSDSHGTFHKPASW